MKAVSSAEDLRDGLEAVLVHVQRFIVNIVVTVV